MATTDLRERIDTIRDQIIRANPNDLSDMFRLVSIGRILSSQIPQALRRRAPAAGPYVDSTLHVLRLPGYAKAAAILRATAVAGTVTGELAPQAFGITPATGQCAVSPSGDVVFLAADAIASVDVVYVPERGEEVEVVLPVDPATGILIVPPGIVEQGAILLSEAESLEGSVAAKMEVLVPTSSAPAAGNARLSLAKDRVHFAVADGVTKARVRLVLAPPPDEDLDRLLRSPSRI